MRDDLEKEASGVNHNVCHGWVEGWILEGHE